MNKKRAGKPRHSKDIKKTYTIRMTEEMHSKVVDKYGSFSLGVSIICEKWGGIKDSLKIFKNS